MTLPIDRTKLLAYTENAAPNNVFGSTIAKDTMKVAFDTIDELYNFYKDALAGIYNSDKFSQFEIIIVKDKGFGAKGDGVTDDRASIQAAINACASKGGGIVFLPIGTYILSATNYIKADGSTHGLTSLTMKDGVRLVGASKEKTILKLRNSDPAIGPGALGRIISCIDTGVSDISIRNLTVDGNKQNQGQTNLTQYDNINITAPGKSNITIEDVRSINANGNAIVVKGSTTSYVTNVRYHKNDVDTANTIGLQCSQFDGLVITDNIIRNTGDNSIDIYGNDGTTTCHGKNFVISDNVCENGLVGIFNETVREGVVANNKIYDCEIGITVNRINGEPKSIEITGNQIDTVSNTGVRVTGDTGGILISNNFVSNYTNSAFELQGTSVVCVKDNFIRVNSSTNPLILLSGAFVRYCQVINNIPSTYPTGIIVANQIQITATTTAANTLMAFEGDVNYRNGAFSGTLSVTGNATVGGSINNVNVTRGQFANLLTTGYGTITLSDKDAGILVLTAYQGGVGTRNAQAYLVNGSNTNARVVALGASEANMMNVTTSGLDIRIAPVYNNTNVTYELFKITNFQ